MSTICGSLHLPSATGYPSSPKMTISAQSKASPASPSSECERGQLTSRACEQAASTSTHRTKGPRKVPLPCAYARRMPPGADLLAALRALVEAESPSEDVAATERCADVAAQIGEAALGRAPRRVESGGRRHLLWPADPVRVLVLGHVDTVWPLGTL